MLRTFIDPPSPLPECKKSRGLRRRITLSRRLARHREWLLLPLFIGAMLLAIKGCHWLTGREPLDDPGELVAACYRAIRLAIAVAFAAFVQEHLCGFRSEKNGSTFRDDLYDSCVTLSLLLLFSWLLWH